MANLLCKLGLHEWKGCKCARCGETRDEEHSWDGCKCTKCRRTRDEEHSWDGCKCTKCGKVRDTGHKIENYKCQKCGRTMPHSHQWSDFLCSICGAIEPGAMEKILDELCQIAARQDRSDKARTRELGEIIYEVGKVMFLKQMNILVVGDHAAMVQAWEMVANRVGSGKARIIEMWWDGIGSWRK